MDNKEEINMALGRAAGDGNIEALKTFIAKGADVNFGFGLPLRFAAAAGNSNIVEYLIQQAGADVHVSNDDPLLLAISNNRLETAQVLLSHGANPLAEKEHETHLAAAARMGNPKMIDLLLNFCTVNHTLLDDLLVQSAADGKLDAVNFLIRRGADPFGVNQAAYNIAVVESHLEVHSFLESVMTYQKESFLFEMDLQENVKKWLRRNYRDTDEPPLVRACSMGLLGAVTERMVLLKDTLTLDDLHNLKDNSGKYNLLDTAGSWLELDKIFNPALWPNRVHEMQQVWESLPEDIKKYQKVDMASIVADFRLKQLKETRKNPVTFKRPKP